MNKADLKTGMTVELRDGMKYLVLRGVHLWGSAECHDDVLFAPHGFWMPLERYTDDMRYIGKGNTSPFFIESEENMKKRWREYDIVKVFSPRYVVDIGEIDRCKLIWLESKK